MTPISILLLLHGLAGFSVAAFSIGLPLPHTPVFANTHVLVTWLSVPPTVTTVSIELARGPSENALTTLMTLAQGLDASQKSTLAFLPKDAPNGSGSYIVIQGNDTPPSKAVVPIYIMLGSKSIIVPTTTTTIIHTTTIATTTTTTTSVKPSTTTPSPSPSPTAQSSSTSPSRTETSTTSETTTSSSGSLVPTATKTPDPNPGDLSLTTPQLAGIVVGGLGVVGLAFGAACLMRRKRRRRQDDREVFHDMFVEPTPQHHNNQELYDNPYAAPTYYQRSPPPVNYAMAPLPLNRMSRTQVEESPVKSSDYRFYPEDYSPVGDKPHTQQ